MTCIVGIVENNKVYIGGDSAGVSGGGDRVVRHDVKVFRNGDCIFGCTTSFRMIQVLQYLLKVPRQTKTYTNDHHFVVAKIIPQIQTAFKKNCYGSNDDDGAKGGTFLLGYRGVLYTIYEDFQVGINKNQIDSVGCGSRYALGALYALRSDCTMAPKEKLEAALNISAHLHGGVMAPFHYEVLEG